MGRARPRGEAWVVPARRSGQDDVQPADPVAVEREAVVEVDLAAGEVAVEVVAHHPDLAVLPDVGDLGGVGELGAGLDDEAPQAVLAAELLAAVGDVDDDGVLGQEREGSLLVPRGLGLEEGPDRGGELLGDVGVGVQALERGRSPTGRGKGGCLSPGEGRSTGRTSP
ncbi:hypothetical protein GCM10023340_03770 [Nocardioides marinquilinus]|uniref:Uncharacterized protein n=1 Tax=Nocardioides marinquilinus TaxID=1210400 RepID=A0ABP9P8J3_9ACTN